MQTLSGTTAIVTGASRGIGRAISRRMAEAGAWVAMVSRGEEDLAAAAREAGGHPFAADVTSPEAVERMMARITAEAGAPHLVVSSAGSFSMAPFAETDPAEFDRQIAVNLRGPFLVARAALPAMLERRAGHVINIGSVAGRVALPGNAAYGAAKFGLRGLHEILLEELRGSGVRATLVEPAATDTPLWDPIDPDRRDDLPSRAAMLRPDDVARAVLYAATQPPEVEISVVAVRSTA